MKRSFPIVLTFFLLAGSPSLAVQTSHWTQSGQSDFQDGTLHSVVVSNLGDVKLSRALKTLIEQDPRVTSVTAVAQAADGTIYVGTGPQGVLLAISGDKVKTIATIDETVTINALLFDNQGRLLIGASGAKGRVFRIEKPGDAPKEIFSEKDVQYVWAITQSPDGMLYAATGPNGQLFKISPDGSHDVLYKSDQTNLTSLINDGADLLYLGTDPEGLVVRINRKTGEWFVLYDAAEEEITALALDADGNLYAATGSPLSEQAATPPTEVKPVGGRPEATPPGQTPIPSKPPTPPAPPPQPTPPPLPAIPRSSTRPVNLMILPDTLATDDPGASPDQPPADASGDSSDTGSPDTQGDKTPVFPGADAGDQSKPHGNAIYQIDKDGFVNEVFRQDVVIYSMVQANGLLIVGTGPDGLVYQVDPKAEETIVLAKTDAKQVTAMLGAPDGRIILGLSNTGSLATMTAGFADTGTFISSVLDATQVSRFGAIQMHGLLPAGTTLTIATRSGNLKDAEAGGWSKWSDEQPAAEFVKCKSPSARFLQYRFTFNSQDGIHTPVIKDIDLAYQMPNLAPVIKSIKLEAVPANGQGGPGGAESAGPPTFGGKPPEEAKPQGTGTQAITWDASDPNGDSLVYSLYFRPTAGGPWILMKDNLTDPAYAWDTRAVADGRYEIKVVASDALANPPGQGKLGTRISDPVVVDNTPPVIGDIKTTITGESVNITLRVVDRTSTVAALEYSVDSSEVWQSVLPDDKIWDDPEETATLVIPVKGAGPHQIALRATDSHGNQSIENVPVTIAAPAAGQ